ncbi:hypothetical protein TIFTF001_009724 [Ficus carica]|uniref:Uncharacterized protein n=1 Tax=Ficus carica TaxID=3494 RepID=A0AA88D3V0_FICCA|nr:hypothetical protein TIFTF001_009724 [Ficus carica]
MLISIATDQENFLPPAIVQYGRSWAWVAGSWSVMKGLLPAACPCSIQARTPTCSSGGGRVQRWCRCKNNLKLLLHSPSPPAVDSSVVS